MDRRRYRRRHAVERHARALGLAHQPPHEAVAFAERHAGLDQQVGQVRGAERRVERGAHAVRVRGHAGDRTGDGGRSEEHTSELQSQSNLVCRLLLEKKKTIETSVRASNTRRNLHSELFFTVIKGIPGSYATTFELAITPRIITYPQQRQDIFTHAYR